MSTAVLEALGEKMPESPWHNWMVEGIKQRLEEHLAQQEGAFVFRDLFFEQQGKRYAPDIAVVLRGSPPMEGLGLVYRVPEDGPAPDAIMEVAVSAKALGEALGEKARFYCRMGVRDYLVVEAFPGEPLQLWAGKPATGERPQPVKEVFLESLEITVRVDGKGVRLFDRDGNEILSPREALAQGRAKREELERRVAELERRLQEGGR